MASGWKMNCGILNSILANEYHTATNIKSLKINLQRYSQNHTKHLDM
jgi:hypothetical protein